MERGVEREGEKKNAVDGRHRYVFFDFDGTLTTRDTLIGFIRYVNGTGGLVSALIRSIPAIIRWKLGHTDSGMAKERLFGAAFGGMDADDFRNAGRAYSSEIEQIERTSTVSAMCEALGRGDTTAIVSASIDDWIRPWAEAKGVRYVLATEAEIGADGRLTGKFATPNCLGAEKVRRVLAQFPELSADLCADCEVTAWGDSDGDDELLAFADHPVKV